jgi:hypothetical protein
MGFSPSQAFHWESRLQYLEYAKKGTDYDDLEVVE